MTTAAVTSSEAIDFLRSKGISRLYHFTDAANVDSIMENGLYSWFSCEQRCIRVARFGGNDRSRGFDRMYGLQDYVRTSLCCDHPMAFRLKCEGSRVVLLKISLDVLGENSEFVCSDVNAASASHRQANGIAGLSLIDYGAVKRTRVSKIDPDFHKHQAEIMVRTHIPPEYIGIVGRMF